MCIQIGIGGKVEACAQKLLLIRLKFTLLLMMEHFMILFAFQKSVNNTIFDVLWILIGLV